jgi:hypothetical protein
MARSAGAGKVRRIRPPGPMRTVTIKLTIEGLVGDPICRYLRPIALHPCFCRNKKSEAIGKTQPSNFIKASQQATRCGSMRVRTTESLSTSSMSFPSQA